MKKVDSPDEIYGTHGTKRIFVHNYLHIRPCFAKNARFLVVLYATKDYMGEGFRSLLDFANSFGVCPVMSLKTLLKLLIQPNPHLEAIS